MATLRATTSKATLAFFSGAIGVSKLAIRPGAATIRGSMTIGARCRIRFFSCLGARCLNEGGHVCFWPRASFRGEAIIQSLGAAVARKTRAIGREPLRTVMTLLLDAGVPQCPLF